MTPTHCEDEAEQPTAQIRETMQQTEQRQRPKARSKRDENHRARRARPTGDPGLVVVADVLVVVVVVWGPPPEGAELM